MIGKKIYLAQPWGGLGDQLAYSNLPRLYSKKNYEFNISFLNYSRNSEITDFVWKNNKYVNNTKAYKIPNAGYVMFNKKTIDSTNLNSVQTINVLHGFEAGDGFPEIYLKDFNKEKLIYKNICDLNMITMNQHTDRMYDPKSIKELINYLNNNKFHFLTFPNIYKDVNSSLNSIKIESLQKLISILLKTENFYCLSSGSHSLAATLKSQFGVPKKIVCYNPDFDNTPMQGYWYSNVEYKSLPTVKNLNKKISRNTRHYQKLLNFFS